MNKREISFCKLLALVALSGVLPAGLGACQKENAVMPFGKQVDKTSAQPDANTGDTSNMKQQTDQNGGDTSQKNQ